MDGLMSLSFGNFELWVMMDWEGRNGWTGLESACGFARLHACMLTTTDAPRAPTQMLKDLTLDAAIFGVNLLALTAL